MTTALKTNIPFWREFNEGVFAKINKGHADELIARQDLIKSKSWLQNGSPLGNLSQFKSWSVFGQTNNNPFILKTPMEGYPVSDSLHYFNSLLSNTSNLAQREEWRYVKDFTPELQEFTEHLQRSENIAKRLIQINIDSYKEHKDQIINSILKLFTEVPEDKIREILGECFSIFEIQDSEEQALAESALNKKYPEAHHYIEAFIKTAPPIIKSTVLKKLKLYSEELAKDYAAKPGWLPGGYSSGGSGHTMMYWIDPQSRVTIINTGDGINKFHPSVRETSIDPLTKTCKEEDKYQLFVTTASVDKERLKHPDFFLAVLTHHAISKVDQNIVLDADHVYSGILGYLNTKFEPGFNSDSYPELYKKGQRGGNCTFQAIKEAFFHHLCHAHINAPRKTKEAKECFKVIKFFWEVHTLVSHCKSIKPPLTQEARNQLQDGVSNVAREAEKLHKKGKLSQTTLEELHATFLDIENNLQISYKESPLIRPLQEKGPIQDHFENHYKVNQNAIPEIVVVPKKPAQAAAEDKKVEAVKLTLEERLTALTMLLNDSSQVDTNKIENFAHDLKAIVSEISEKALSKTLNQADALHALSLLRQFLCKMPVPTQQEDFWNSIPVSQLDGIMVSLHSMMHCLLQLNIATGNRKSKKNSSITHDPESVVLMYGMYAIIDKLARRYPDNVTHLNGFTTNYFDIISEMNLPEFIVRHPEVQELLRGVMRYFHSEFNVETTTDRDIELHAREHSTSLFSFNKMKVTENKPPIIGAFTKDLTKKTLNKMQTFKWAKKLVANSTDEQLLKYGIHGGMSTMEKVSQIIKQLGKEQSDLPQPITMLAQASLKCLVLIHATQFDSTLQSLKDTETIAIKVTKYNSNEEGYSIRISEPDIINYVGYSSRLGYAVSNLNSQIGEDGATLIQAMLTKSTQNEMLISQDKPHKTLDLDISHELRMIGFDPYDEVARVVDFGTRHIFAQEFIGVQDLLRIHLLRPDRLHSQFKDKPEIVAHIIEYFKKGLKYFGEQGNDYAYIYFAQLGKRVQAFIEFEGLKGDFPHFRNMLYDYLRPKSQDMEKKLKMFEYLIWLNDSTPFSKSKDQPEVVEDVFSLAMLRALFSKNTVMKRDYSYQGIEKEFLPLLQDQIKSSGRVPDKLLQKLLWVINAPEDGGQWKGEYPLYENDLYQIDLKNLTIHEKNKGVHEALPTEIRSHEVFKQLIKGAFTGSRRDEQTGRYWINMGQADELIAERKEKDVNFYKYINGIEYRYIQSSQLPKDRPLFLKDEMQYWVSKNNPKHALVLNKKNERLYQINLAENQIGFNLDSIIRLKDNLQWIPFHSLDDCWKKLHAVEHRESEIECWGINGELSEINLDKQGLHINVKAENGIARAFLQEFPEFFLVDVVDNNTLLLSNVNGVKKIIKGNAVLTSKIILNNMNMPVHRVQATFGPNPIWLEYHEDLTSHSVEANILLFYDHLCRGRYEEAKKLLPKTKSYLLYTESENSIIQNINNFTKTASHPTARALGLSFFLQVEENLLLNQSSVKPINKNQNEKKTSVYLDYEFMLELMQNYENIQTNTPLHELTENEEKRLLHLIKNAYIVKIKEIKAEIKKLKKEGQPTKDTEETLERILFEFEQFKSRYQHRINYLETGKTTLGFKNTPYEERNESTEALTFEDFQWVLANDQQIEFGDDASVIINEADFQKKFFGYYNIAKSGTKVQRARLKRLLDLNQVPKNKTHRLYRNLLKSVCNFPWLFPKLDTKLAALKVDIQTYATSSKNAIELEAKIKDKEFSEAEKKKNSEQSDKILTENDESKKKIEKVLKEDFKKLAKRSYLIELFSFKPMWRAASNFLSYITHLFKKVFNKKLQIAKRPDFLSWSKHNLAELDKSFENYFSEKRQHHLSQEPVGLDLLSQELGENSKILEKELNVERQKLLWQINHVPDQSHIKLLHQEGRREILLWKDLQALTLKGDMHLFCQKTHLDREMAEMLHKGVASYLLKELRLHQMRTIIKAIQIHELNKNDPDKDFVGLLERDISTAMMLMRSVPITPEAHYKLWFEFKNLYLLRKEQLDKIDEIVGLDKKEKMVQCPTGYGKTKTLIPLLNKELKDKGHHVSNVYPFTAEIESGDHLNREVEDAFCDEMDRFEFNRNSLKKSESLELRYKKLLSGKADFKRPESPQAFELHFLTDLKKRCESGFKLELDRCLSAFIKILRFYRLPHEVAIVDEAQCNWNPFDKLIYTDGDWHRIPESQLDFFEVLFKLILSPKYKDKLKIRENQQAFLTPKDFEKVALDLALDLKKPPAEIISEPLFAIDQESDYLDFVLSKKTDVPQWVIDHPKREYICLVKGMLSLVLESSLHGFVDENYGLSKKHFSLLEFAISFSGSNTPKENELTPSQFKNPHETLIKTYCTYFYKELTQDQVKKLINREKGRAASEISVGIAPSETEAHKFFRKLVPDLFPKKFVHQINDEEIAAIHEKICKNEDAIFYYIRHFVAQQIKIYPRSYVSTVQNARSSQYSSISFSATPPHASSIGPETHAISMDEVKKKSLELLLKKGAGNIDIIDTDEPEAIFNSVLNKMSNNHQIHSVIDTGGLLRGLTNIELCNKVRKDLLDSNRNDIHFIRFFDENEERFKAMDVLKGTIHLLDNLDLDPRFCITLHDQNRSFAADIKQTINNIAYLLLGKESTFDDAAQGMGRNRKIHENQGLRIGITRSVADLIFDKDADGKHIIDIQKLVDYLIAKQTFADAERNFQSQILQMDNEIRNALICKILGLPIGKEPDISFLDKIPDINEAVKLYKLYEKELVTSDSTDPFVLYASMPKKGSAIEALTSYRKHCLDKVNRLLGLTAEEKRAILIRLNNYHEEKWKQLTLPKEVMISKAGLGMLCEVLQEVEVEAQVQQQVQKYDTSFVRKPWKWPSGIDLFNPGWEKPRNMVILYKKLSLYIQEIGQSIKMKLKNSKLNKWYQERKDKNPTSDRTWIVIKYGVATVVTTILSTLLPAVPGFILIAFAIAAFALKYLSTYEWYQELKVKAGKAWDNFIHPICPTYCISDVLKVHLPSRLSKGAKFFDSNLIVSNNFWTQKTKSGNPVQKPFSPTEEKPLQEVLVVEDNGKFTIMVIDMNDSIYFRRKLKIDHETPLDKAQKRNRKVAVYDLHLGTIVAQGKNQFDEKQLKNNPEFEMLIMKAKILSGGVLSQREQELYHKEALKVGLEVMEKIRYDYILALHPIQKLLHQKNAKNNSKN